MSLKQLRILIRKNFLTILSNHKAFVAVIILIPLIVAAITSWEATRSWNKNPAEGDVYPDNTGQPPIGPLHTCSFFSDFNSPLYITSSRLADQIIFNLESNGNWDRDFVRVIPWGVDPLNSLQQIDDSFSLLIHKETKERSSNNDKGVDSGGSYSGNDNCNNNDRNNESYDNCNNNNDNNDPYNNHIPSTTPTPPYEASYTIRYNSNSALSHFAYLSNGYEAARYSSEEDFSDFASHLALSSLIEFSIAQLNGFYPTTPMCEMSPHFELAVARMPWGRYLNLQTSNDDAGFFIHTLVFLVTLPLFWFTIITTQREKSAQTYTTLISMRVPRLAIYLSHFITFFIVGSPLVVILIIQTYLICYYSKFIAIALLLLPILILAFANIIALAMAVSACFASVEVSLLGGTVLYGAILALSFLFQTTLPPSFLNAFSLTLFPSTASEGIKQMIWFSSRLEINLDVISDFFTLLPNRYLSMGFIYLILFSHFIILLLLGLYLESILKQSDYIIALPWYYPVTSLLRLMRDSGRFYPKTLRDFTPSVVKSNINSFFSVAIPTHSRLELRFPEFQRGGERFGEEKRQGVNVDRNGSQNDYFSPQFGQNGRYHDHFSTPSNTTVSTIGSLNSDDDNGQSNGLPYQIMGTITKKKDNNNNYQHNNTSPNPTPRPLSPISTDLSTDSNPFDAVVIEAPKSQYYAQFGKYGDSLHPNDEYLFQGLPPLPQGLEDLYRHYNHEMDQDINNGDWKKSDNNEQGLDHNGQNGQNQSQNGKNSTKSLSNSAGTLFSSTPLFGSNTLHHSQNDINSTDNDSIHYSSEQMALLPEVYRDKRALEYCKGKILQYPSDFEKNNPSITLKHITKTFPSSNSSHPNNALDDLNLRFYRGQIHAILGRNGTGKSLLLAIVAKMNLPTSGSVFIHHPNGSTSGIHKGQYTGEILEQYRSPLETMLNDPLVQSDLQWKAKSKMDKKMKKNQQNQHNHKNNDQNDNNSPHKSKITNPNFGHDGEYIPSYGICFQQDTLYDGLSVYENLSLFSQIKESVSGFGLTKDQRDIEIAQLLKMTQLEDKANDFVETLSGGQRRKVSVAIALLHNPQIVIFDNLTSGADVHSQRTIWSLLERQKANRTIIFATQSLQEALIADRITVLKDGNVACSGSATFLKEQFKVGDYVLTIDKEVTLVSTDDPVAMKWVLEGPGEMATTTTTNMVSTGGDGNGIIDTSFALPGYDEATGLYEPPTTTTTAIGSHVGFNGFQSRASMGINDGLNQSFSRNLHSSNNTIHSGDINSVTARSTFIKSAFGNNTSSRYQNTALNDSVLQNHNQDVSIPNAQSDAIDFLGNFPRVDSNQNTISSINDNSIDHSDHFSSTSLHRNLSPLTYTTDQRDRLAALDPFSANTNHNNTQNSIYNAQNIQNNIYNGNSDGNSIITNQPTSTTTSSSTSFPLPLLDQQQYFTQGDSNTPLGKDEKQTLPTLVVDHHNLIMNLPTSLLGFDINKMLRLNSDTAMTLSYTIQPGEEDNIPMLLDYLEVHKERLWVKTISITTTTLDDVFDKIHEDVHPQCSDYNGHGDDGDYDRFDDFSELGDVNNNSDNNNNNNNITEGITNAGIKRENNHERVQNQSPNDQLLKEQNTISTSLLQSPSSTSTPSTQSATSSTKQQQKPAPKPLTQLNWLEKLLYNDSATNNTINNTNNSTITTHISHKSSKGNNHLMEITDDNGNGSGIIQELVNEAPYHPFFNPNGLKPPTIDEELRSIYTPQVLKHWYRHELPRVTSPRGKFCLRFRAVLVKRWQELLFYKKFFFPCLLLLIFSILCLQVSGWNASGNVSLRFDDWIREHPIVVFEEDVSSTITSSQNGLFDYSFSPVDGHSPSLSSFDPSSNHFSSIEEKNYFAKFSFDNNNNNNIHNNAFYPDIKTDIDDTNHLSPSSSSILGMYQQNNDQNNDQNNNLYSEELNISNIPLSSDGPSDPSYRSSFRRHIASYLTPKEHLYYKKINPHSFNALRYYPSTEQASFYHSTPPGTRKTPLYWALAIQQCGMAYDSTVYTPFGQDLSNSLIKSPIDYGLTSLKVSSLYNSTSPVSIGWMIAQYYRTLASLHDQIRTQFKVVTQHNDTNNNNNDSNLNNNSNNNNSNHNNNNSNNNNNFTNNQLLLTPSPTPYIVPKSWETTNILARRYDIEGSYVYLRVSSRHSVDIPYLPLFASLILFLLCREYTSGTHQLFRMAGGGRNFSKPFYLANFIFDTMLVFFAAILTFSLSRLISFLHVILSRHAFDIITFNELPKWVVKVVLIHFLTSLSTVSIVYLFFTFFASYLYLSQLVLIFYWFVLSVALSTSSNQLNYPRLMLDILIGFVPPLQLLVIYVDSTALQFFVDTTTMYYSPGQPISPPIETINFIVPFGPVLLYFFYLFVLQWSQSFTRFITLMLRFRHQTGTPSLYPDLGLVTARGSNHSNNAAVARMKTDILSQRIRSGTQGGDLYALVTHGIRKVYPRSISSWDGWLHNRSFCLPWVCYRFNPCFFRWTKGYDWGWFVKDGATAAKNQKIKHKRDMMNEMHEEYFRARRNKDGKNNINDNNNGNKDQDQFNQFNQLSTIQNDPFETDIYPSISNDSSSAQQDSSQQDCNKDSSSSQRFSNTSTNISSRRNSINTADSPPLSRSNSNNDLLIGLNYNNINTTLPDSLKNPNLSQNNFSQNNFSQNNFSQSNDNDDANDPNSTMINTSQNQILKPTIALQSTYLAIRKNSVTALLGSNGSGKSTLMSILTKETDPTPSLETLSSQTIFQNDTNLFETPARFISSKKIGVDPKEYQRVLKEKREKEDNNAIPPLAYCPQTNRLTMELTPRQTLVLYSALYGIDPAIYPNLIPNVLDAMLLGGEIADTPCAELSPGRLRLVAIAIAIFAQADLTLLDEFSTNLDPTARRTIHRLLQRLSRTQTIVMTSHIMEEVENLADCVAILSQGELIAYGSKGLLKEDSNNNNDNDDDGDYNQQFGDNNQYGSMTVSNLSGARTVREDGRTVSALTHFRNENRQSSHNGSNFEDHDNKKDCDNSDSDSDIDDIDQGTGPSGSKYGQENGMCYTVNVKVRSVNRVGLVKMYLLSVLAQVSQPVFETQAQLPLPQQREEQDALENQSYLSDTTLITPITAQTAPTAQKTKTSQTPHVEKLPQTLSNSSASVRGYNPPSSSRIVSTHFKQTYLTEEEHQNVARAAMDHRNHRLWVHFLKQCRKIGVTTLPQQYSNRFTITVNTRICSISELFVIMSQCKQHCDDIMHYLCSQPTIDQLFTNVVDQAGNIIGSTNNSNHSNTRTSRYGSSSSPNGGGGTLHTDRNVVM